WTCPQWPARRGIAAVVDLVSSVRRSERSTGYRRNQRHYRQPDRLHAPLRAPGGVVQGASAAAALASCPAGLCPLAAVDYAIGRAFVGTFGFRPPLRLYAGEYRHRRHGAAGAAEFTPVRRRPGGGGADRAGALLLRR